MAKPRVCVRETVPSFMLRLLAIIACGGAGGLGAWRAVSWLGGTGVGGGIASVMIGAFLAASLWIGGVALIGAVKRNR